uniref:KIB1-4 beta-propeller domain-containing protein n=1 Tax=Ananas comosus var. bracteatus TaxID=296719 RepID=A0A6V7NML5_ANACO|nr:unnamed protein product [Ananas comosus var. bracteatus]
MEKMRSPCPAGDVDAATTAPPSPGPWAELPVGILAKNLWRINPDTDLTNFTSVCKAWRAAAADDLLPLKHQMPWLLLTEEDYPGSGGHTRSFYSLSEDKIHELPLPEACRRRCVGSADGWLVTLGEALEGEEMHILNPISRIRIPLPSQSTLLLPPEDYTFPEELIAQNQTAGGMLGPNGSDGEEDLYDSGQEDDYGDDDYDDDYDEDDEDYDDDEDDDEEKGEEEEEGETDQQRAVRERYQSFITKVVLSCSPAKKGSDCVALAIYGWSDNKLAYARPGDAAWTILSWTGSRAVLRGQSSRHGHEMQHPSRRKCRRALSGGDRLRIPYDDLIWGNSTYLVEHQGSLLQVLRKRRASKKTRPDKPLPQHLTFGFHVFRLDPSSSAWEMIESLGDGALFLGMNTSVSVSAADLRWCKGNCIYFTDGDELSRWYAISLGGQLLGGRGAGRDTGYCTLKDWEVHYLDQVASYSPSSPPIWVLPSAS